MSHEKIGCKSKINPGNTSSPDKFAGDCKISTCWLLGYAPLWRNFTN